VRRRKLEAGADPGGNLVAPINLLQARGADAPRQRVEPSFESVPEELGGASVGSPVPGGEAATRSPVHRDAQPGVWCLRPYADG
jgi:hypothetical protein